MDNTFVTKNDYATLLNDGETFYGNNSGWWGVASVSDTQYSSGKYRIAFQYENGITAIGVASIDSNFSGTYILGIDAVKQRALCVANVGFSGGVAGAKYPGGVSYCSPFSIGDIVEMEVDFDNGTIEYFKNGTSLGICFDDLNTVSKPMYIVVGAVVSQGVGGQLSLTSTSETNPIPTNLTATAGDTNVALLWTGVDGATGYNVKRSTTAGGPYTTIASNITGTSYEDTGLVNGTTYYYVVTAISSAIESDNSNEAPATPSAESVPSEQELLRITMLDSSEREYQLPSTDIDGFINWFNRNLGTGTSCYMLDKKMGLQSSKEYLAFDKIISFEVINL